MPFFQKPVRSIVDEVVSGTRTAREIAAQTFSRIGEDNESVNAFVTLNEKRALERADAIDALPAEDKKNRPLLGIPVAVKDNICVRDMTATCGSRMLHKFVPPYNAAVADRLEQAGAVIVGKTNLDEFAMGSSTETSYRGATRNPRDPERVPGGSSGGSAAALAAEMVPLALGSDTGGSIRQPASFCGIAGLKPTYGRVSRYGLVAFASSLDQIGPMAGCVRDTGLLLSAIAGPDARDSTCAGRAFDDCESHYTGEIKGMRLGLPREYFGEGLSGTVRAAVTSAVDGLASEGVEIVDISLSSLEYAIATYYIICTAEASSNLARYDGVKYGYRSNRNATLREMYARTRDEGFGPEVKRRIMLGTYVLSSGYYDAYYLKAAKVRTLIARDFERAFEKCDAIVSPVTPTTAFAIGEKCDDPLRMYLGDIYTVSASLAGIPGISVPVPGDDGLPVGVQFMGPKWREDTLLRLAAGVETQSTGQSV